MKRIARVALSVTVFVSSLASARPSQDIETPRRFVVEKVILTEGDRNLCVADTANRQDLIPYFMRATTESSSAQINLRNCDASELTQIQQLASITVKKADVAALPAMAIGAIAICTITVGMGGFGGYTDIDFAGYFAMTTPAIMAVRGAWWKGPKIALAMGALMATCGAVGFYGVKGIKYLLRDNSSDVEKKQP